MNRKTINTMKQKASFFEKLSKIDKLSAILHRKKTQINEIRTERGDIIINTIGIQRIIRDYHEHYIPKKLDNLE